MCARSGDTHGGYILYICATKTRAIDSSLQSFPLPSGSPNDRLLPFVRSIEIPHRLFSAFVAFDATSLW